MPGFNYRPPSVPPSLRGRPLASLVYAWGAIPPAVDPDLISIGNATILARHAGYVQQTATVLARVSWGPEGCLAVIEPGLHPHTLGYRQKVEVAARGLLEIVRGESRDGPWSLLHEDVDALFTAQRDAPPNLFLTTAPGGRRGTMLGRALADPAAQAQRLTSFFRAVDPRRRMYDLIRRFLEQKNPLSLEAAQELLASPGFRTAFLGGVALILIGGALAGGIRGGENS